MHTCREIIALFVFIALAATSAVADENRLSLSWEKNYLTIRGEKLPSDGIRIHYLEAYCRPGSTNRDWSETVIPHQTKMLDGSGDHVIRLECRLRDGVVVRHEITAQADEVDFRLTAENTSDSASEAHWAQPCIRVGNFTGETQETYVPKCFIFHGGKLARLPTMPWAEKALYVPGQVYCPRHVDRDDVNPRPLSEIVPDNGLTGCFSHDESMILATAWEPYQELFQGVGICIHSDFRLGGLKGKETKTVRGKLYLVSADVKGLLERYHRDFPEHKGAE